MREAKSWDFSGEGVTVKMPAQARRLRAVKLPVSPIEQLPAVAGGFTPGRIVANIVVEDEDQPGVFLSEFDPPFELRVRYTPADEQRANRAGKALELAYFMEGRWERFTQEKHGFRLEPDKNGVGGVGVASIRRWGDPNISWGP